MTAREITQRIFDTKSRLESLSKYLQNKRFSFAAPDEVLPGPDARTEEILARIERETGNVPAALAEFYSIIGSVNLNGHHPGWEGCDYPDALIVFPVTYAEAELDEFLAGKDYYIQSYGSFRIPIAPDFYHKEGVSGGPWYGVGIPSEGADPRLLEERHQTTFLNYLDIALSWGGFPGLENAQPDHTWPLPALRHAASGAEPH